MKKYKISLTSKKRNRSNNIYILFIVVFILYIVFLFFKTHYYTSRNCVIKYINIEGTNPRVRSEILNMLKGLDNYTLNNVDIYKIKKKIKSNSLIYEASVVKIYPNTISIKIIENKSCFIWQNSNDEFYLVNSENKIIRKAKIDEYKKLILIKGGNLPIKASDDIRFYVYSNKELIDKVKTISFNGYSWDLYLTNGIIIKLPEFNIDYAVKFLLAMNHKYQLLSRDILYIDARVPRKLFVKQSNN